MATQANEHEETKQGVLRRLKSIEGHIRGVQRMVESDAYCIEIMGQTYAIQRALDAVNNLVLERHLQTCVTTAIRGEDQSERERVIRELMQVFEAVAKR
ncbi:MAG: metal-sensitive transcriptional regulator [Chloroflexi bacterium]|nr:metal-sensitive transcriptional regulator [Chloroflexota bacterium]